MMAVHTNGTGTTRLDGVVAGVNERGIRLQGRDGWLATEAP
jgi:hypothetical protein